MTVLVSEDGVGWRGDHFAIDHGEAGIAVSDHEEAFILCCHDSCNWWANFSQGLLSLVQRAGSTGISCWLQQVFVEAVVGQEGQLVRNLCNELEASDVINKYSTALGAKQQPVIACANLCKEDTVLAHCAHKLSSAV